MRLAASLSSADSRHGDIYAAVTSLIETNGHALSLRERTLAADICKRLSRDVEMSIRLALAERLAGNEDAPRDLVLLLADDRIEVARPLLLRSPILGDDDLIRIVRGSSADHQVTVASRPQLAEIVSAALAASDNEIVVVALVKNKTAKIGEDTFHVLTERARATPALHGPLTERADLPRQTAARLFSMVSDALKTALTQRYPAAASALAYAVDESANAVRAGAPQSSEANASKLVAKLAAGGQLRASFLVRVLHQGQMDVFEHGFANLLGIEVEPLRYVLYKGKPALAASACRAVGIDRSVFATVFNRSRQARGVRAMIKDADQHDIAAAFAATKAEAFGAVLAALEAPPA